ncbi:AGAP013348-PA-like protein [Anopheles sinensis]|uniref:AGAP013348-PA-like protein n=1 Tax=Anopheles sinensis TaxID=74873 RepID=A0A084VLL2_ANOSI|nr:AGAP013348-PA-like protein [Anopheles sinensis]
MYTLRRLVTMALALLVAILQCFPCGGSPVMLDKLFGFAAYQPTYSGGGYGSNQYGYYGGGGGGGYGGHQHAPTSSHKRQAKGRDYKDICRVVNPAPYALPGRAPYPAAPFCPY